MRLSPPGVRALPADPAVRRDLRRRRGQRRGEPRAVRPREPLRDAAARTTPSATAAVQALRAEGVRTELIVRGGDRIGIYYAETGASQRASKVIYDRAQSAISEMTTGHGGLGRGARGRGVVPLHRHHAGARRQRRGSATGSARGRAQGRGRGVSMDLNFRKKLWSEKTGAVDDASADGAAWTSSSPTKRTSSRCSASRRRARTSRPGSSNLEAYHARRRASRQRASVCALDRHHAAREPLGERQRLERGDLRRRPPATSIAASTTTCGWWIASAAATASRAASSTAWSRASRPWRRAPIRGRGERAQADDSRRLQSRVASPKSIASCRRRRERPRAALTVRTSREIEESTELSGRSGRGRAGL